MLHKIRHIVEVSQYTTINYTNYEVTFGILIQVTLSTISTDTLNLGRVQASDFIQQFWLEIQHKPAKLHIISNALSRLKTINKNPIITKKSELNKFFTVVLVKINSNFYKFLLEHYTKNLFYIKIYKTLNKKASKDKTKLLFVGKKKLIFYTKKGFVKQFCVLSALAKDIFDIIHDQSSHIGFAKCYKYVALFYYIKSFLELFRDYFKHYP